MSKNVYWAEEMDTINNQFLATDEITIFRYMDFSKFMDLLENKKLYFCKSNYFEDKYEGRMPEGFYCNWTKEMVEGHKGIYDEIDKHYGAYITCWNIGSNESYALWKIYTNPNTGIAIKTTVGKLKKALNNEAIQIYNVKYIDSFDDKNQDCEMPHYLREAENGFSISRDVKEVYKLSTYKYEEEVRAIFIDTSKDNGKKFDIDLATLVDEIYISPFASEWFENLVRKVMITYGFPDIRLIKSIILLNKNN